MIAVMLVCYSSHPQMGQHKHHVVTLVGFLIPEAKILASQSDAKSYITH